MVYVLHKWDYKKHDYVPEAIEGNYYFTFYENDMSKLFNCPHCKKSIKVGDAYTSMEYHNNIGLGLLVCKNCCDDEWKRRKHYEQMGDSE